MMLERCQDCSLFIDSRTVDDEVLVAYDGLPCEDHSGHALMPFMASSRRGCRNSLHRYRPTLSRPGAVRTY